MEDTAKAYLIEIANRDGIRLIDLKTGREVLSLRKTKPFLIATLGYAVWLVVFIATYILNRYRDQIFTSDPDPRIHQLLAESVGFFETPWGAGLMASVTIPVLFAFLNSITQYSIHCTDGRCEKVKRKSGVFSIAFEEGRDASVVKNADGFVIEGEGTPKITLTKGLFETSECETVGRLNKNGELTVSQRGGNHLEAIFLAGALWLGVLQ